jgi:hypothetical protein
MAQLVDCVCAGYIDLKTQCCIVVHTQHYAEGVCYESKVYIDGNSSGLDDSLAKRVVVAGLHIASTIVNMVLVQTRDVRIL